MGIPAGKIRGAGADAGGEHGGDGTGTAASDDLREAYPRAKRHSGAGGGVFHIAEAGADRRAGAAVFLLHDTAAGDFVHRGLVHRRSVRAGAEKLAGRGDESGDGGVHKMALLSAAEL